jgi:hypothetical protein
MKKLKAILILTGIVVVLVISFMIYQKYFTEDFVKLPGDKDNWVKLSGNKNENVFLYSKDSVKQISKDTFKIWTKKIYSYVVRKKEIQKRTKFGKFTEGYDKVSYSISLLEIDCKENMGRGLDDIDYDKEGKELSSKNYGYNSFHIVPDSVVDYLRIKVCPNK